TPDEAPLRVSEISQPVAVPEISPPPPPPPAPRLAPAEGTLAETIVADRPSPRPQSRNEAKERQAAPYTGRFAEVKQHLAAGRTARARALAEAWNAEAPGGVLAPLARGAGARAPSVARGGGVGTPRGPGRRGPGLRFADRSLPEPRRHAPAGRGAS